jgi:CheY-like chemotaxis protein
LWPSNSKPGFISPITISPLPFLPTLQLPGADGWTMIRRLKANPETRHTPVFTVSPEEDHLAASVHGAAGHVVEPITASGLDARFTGWNGYDQ